VLIAWIAFPLVLLAVGLGWGVLVLRLAGADPRTALVAPLGLAAALVVADLLTSWSATAGLAVPVVAIGAVAGLLLARRRPRLSPWPAAAAIAVLVMYAAPVLLSGRPTFAGYVRLDDTATWLGIVDRVMSHGRSLAGLSPSTYQLNVSAYLVAGGYPTGSFMLLGIGRALTGADAAWVFQPYLACCAAALALGVYALVSPLVASPRLRALIAFLAAQPALLYGYSLWGGIKELTAAFLLVLVAALAAALLRHPPGPRRAMVPLAVASAALAVTLGPGAVAWVAPALAVVALFWLRRGRRTGVGVARALVSGTGLVVLTVALSVPVLVVLASFLRTDSALFSSGTGGAPAVGLGNLVRPLSVFQLAGIWPVGDFRYAPARLPTALLIWVVGVTAAAGVWLSVTRRREGPALYLALAAIGCAGTALAGGTPWVVGKALAIASPALLACGLTFAAAAVTRRRVWLAAIGVIAGGVLWSNALAYHDVLLAPQGRLAELADIGGMVANAGPTLLNEYEIYGDRHFLRAGAPQEPAEYRPSLIALRDGTLLTKSGWADLDSFPLSSLLPFRSIVVRRSPAESRPPSVYRLRWQGSFYELWQRPAAPATRVIAHVALGDSSADPWCGSAVGQPPRALCSAQAAGTPACSLVRQLGHSALVAGAELVAYQRPLATVLRATATTAPPGWVRNAAAGSVRATTPGTLRARVRLGSAQRYGLWLGGSFARGFVVSVDGRRIGRVKDQLSAIGQYVHVADLPLGAGVHEVDLRFPHADLSPGSGDTTMTTLDAISLVPAQRPASTLLTLAPRQAGQLCGRPLDWIEVVVPARTA
jgi:hypothetical protein